ncbi:hypothetical protein BGW36DRAFT_434010 [Talaromyces proteolyticus]|uniref:MGS207 protein n=1 Tax=Talaromyces proteolyticus TaxID=1131652 RepID=A0AAD4PRE2_9EURO|nr:uncharacterized protein BGW36DRAFT_434010 [Talaromyces proteolyticus]KAH8688711.1 hypothetical protein BGW36DRAFT_434010 [Talaromyces proteolyticus]
MAITTAVTLPPASRKLYLEPAPIFDASDVADKRRQTLKRLLENGHSTVAPLREPKLILHSHLPHLLGSAYILGASSKLLEELYEHEITELIHVDDKFIRGHSISTENWRDFLTQKEYTVAYVDFFDEQVATENGDWKKVLQEYLYSGSEPIINGLIGGLGHPFIHLAYAWELQSGEVATEGLSLACTEYIGLHGLLDHSPPDNSTYKTTNLVDVITRVRDDKRFDGLFSNQGITNIEALLQKRFDALLEHWNAWQITDPTTQLEQCCDLSVLLGIGTGDKEGKFDFYLIHVMTVAHAIRILWQTFPEDRQSAILRQYGLFVLLVYICQQKPNFSEDTAESISSVCLSNHDWKWVVEKALSHKWAKDSHFFKAVRAPKAFSETYGKKDEFYLKASLKYVTEFNGWEGFGEGVEGFLPSRDGYRPEDN